MAESAEMRPDRPRRGIGAALVRRIPDVVWMVAAPRSYDPTLRGRVVYLPFFPGPPADA